MNLCDDRNIFQQAVLQASTKLNIHPAIIEKDYYVTQMLHRLVTEDPNIIFKGGTSLSKCYKLINRFSEDIDLSYENHGTHMSEGTRRRFSKLIRESGTVLNLELDNADKIRSRRDFNQYVFQYSSCFGLAPVKPTLVVETAVFIQSFPTEIKMADSYLHQFLVLEGKEELLSEYSLTPFQLTVQTRERTFIDKVFAVCDYYLTGNIAKHSRHLYDLHKLFPTICINDDLTVLARDTRSARKESAACPSAKDNCQLQALLHEIIDKDIYKEDYEEITSKLLFEKVTYTTVISSLEEISELAIWDN